MPAAGAISSIHPLDMRPIEASVTSRGGLAATFELYGDGFTRNSIRWVVGQERLVRVRQGWYGLPDTPPELLQAARVGGRLTCLSGVKLHGVWQYPTNLLHVSVSEHACRLRQPGDKTRRLEGSNRVRVHWRDRESSGSRLLLKPAACLADLLNCQPPEVVLTAADSALNSRVINLEQWHELLSETPKEVTRLLADAEPRCESGIETLTRIRLAPFRLRMRPQVHIPGIGRVDFLIGELLVIEVDGAEYHTDPVRFEADRRRDAILSRLGYRVLRFSYLQVMSRWREVEDAILAAVIRGDHC